MRALLILLLLASTAHAQKAQRKTAPDKFAKAAGEAFNAAVTADTGGDLRTALGLYQKAYAISPHPSTMYNIADVQRRLGNLRDSIKSYETYLVLSPDAKDRAEVESVLEQLTKTPGTINVTTSEVSDPRSLDLPAGYVLVDGEIQKKPGPVPTVKPRNIPMIVLSVPPGPHVVDFVTPLTYAHDECDVGPGETRWCELKAEPRIDGNAIVSSSDRRMDVLPDPKGKDQLYKRFQLPTGKTRMIVKDRSYGCAPLAVEIAGANTVTYSFLKTTEYNGFERCRTFDIKQHRLQFAP